MKPLPARIKTLLLSGAISHTSKADRLALQHGISEDDYAEIGRTGELVKRDREGRRCYRWCIIGRDLKGRSIYLCGKDVVAEDGVVLLVLTVHPADE